MRKSCLFFFLTLCLSFQMVWNGSANNLTQHQPNQRTAKGGLQQLQAIKVIQEQHNSRSKKDDPLNQQNRESRMREFVGKMENLIESNQDSSFDPKIMLLPPLERTERLKSIVKNGSGKHTLRMDAASAQDDLSGGVKMADTIYLPENVELSGETLIVANQLVLEKEESFITGNGNLYIVLNGPVSSLSSTKVVPKIRVELRANSNSQRNRIGKLPMGTGRNSVYSKGIASALLRPSNLDLRTVSINKRYDMLLSPASLLLQSGSQGSPGTSGNAGPNGDDGSDGSPRACSKQNGNGRAGTNGGDASPGEKGGTGGTGGDGQPGYDLYFYTEYGSCNSYVVSLYSNGFSGGNGGDGGTGGQGGDAGRGGNGADGANCSCSLDGHGGGNGGNGGDGGTGGKGGDGGTGGTGGKGGNAGNIYVFTTPCSYSYSNYTANGYGAYGGIGGYGGASAPSGSSNSGGANGQGGLGIGEGCPNGDDGSFGTSPGPPASSYGGDQGTFGENGMNGQVIPYWE